MSAFKVGQRVRIVYVDPESMGATFGIAPGREATINAIPAFDGEDCDLIVDDFDGRLFGYRKAAVSAAFAHIRPLTPDRCSEFIADMQRFATLAERDAARIRKIAEEKAS